MGDQLCFSAAISACEKRGHWQQASTLLHKMRELDMSAHMVGFSLKVANSVREKGGQWGLALLREDCMEFMMPDQVIKEITGVMNDLSIIVHGSIIHPKKRQSSANRVANGRKHSSRSTPG